MFGYPAPSLCHRCGLRHFANTTCPSFSQPDTDAMVTGGDEEEDMGICRYDALHALAAATIEAAARADSMGRLEQALRDL
jgi:hypothetical protein